MRAGRKEIVRRFPPTFRGRSIGGGGQHPDRYVRLNAYYDTSESKRTGRDVFVAWVDTGYPELGVFDRSAAVLAYGDTIPEAVKKVLEEYETAKQRYPGKFR